MPPPPPADIPLPPLPPAPAPQSSPVPGGSIPKGGGKLRKKKIGRRPSLSKKSVPVQVPLTGLSRPSKRRQAESSQSSVSDLQQGDSDSESDVHPRRQSSFQVDSDSDSEVNPRRHSRFQRHSRYQVVSDSDTDDSSRRHGNMSAFIEARIQEALAGAGYMKESVFQQAMVDCQQGQSQRMAALEQSSKCR